ncbi:hypothetical protein J4711_13620, partial [Staphylococcus epidermidis]|nr:hypothetical protein [Staphylococcus epidermidis]
LGAGRQCSGELNQLTVRGTIYATAGQVGVRISGGGLASGAFTDLRGQRMGAGFLTERTALGNNNGGANGGFSLSIKTAACMPQGF